MVSDRTLVLGIHAAILTVVGAVGTGLWAAALVAVLTAGGANQTALVGFGLFGAFVGTVQVPIARHRWRRWWQSRGLSVDDAIAIRGAVRGYRSLPQRLHRRVNEYLDWRKRGRAAYGQPSGSAMLVLSVMPLCAPLVRADITSRVPALLLLGVFLVGLAAASPDLIKQRRARQRWQATPPPPIEEPADADSFIRGSSRPSR